MEPRVRRRQPAAATEHTTLVFPSPSSSPTSSSFLDIPPFVVTGSNQSLADVWAVLQTISSQTPSVVLFALSATIVNHARRTFFYGSPWAGFFLRPDYADDWRLVLARPDVFLEAVLASANWRALASSAVGQAACYQVVSRIAETGPTRRIRPAAALAYMVWLLCAIEMCVAQSSTAVAIVWSAVSLLHARPSLLVRIAVQHTRGVLLLAFPAATYCVAGLVPIVMGAVRNSVRRKPGVLLVILGIVGSLRTLLVYRSRLYMAIEMGGLFVFLATFLLSVGLLWAAGRKGEVAKKHS